MTPRLGTTGLNLYNKQTDCDDDDEASEMFESWFGSMNKYSDKDNICIWHLAYLW